MDIGQIIKCYRKKQNLTQEQIADYLNVSTPAVNKWERGISYPDIILLAPLARILKIDINTLLQFDRKLTDDEIKKLCNEVSSIASNKGIDSAFRRADSIIKTYSGCDKLILNLVAVLRIFLMSTESLEREKYQKKIISWLELVKESESLELSVQAKLELSSIYRLEKRYEEAEKLLEKLPKRFIDKRLYQGLLYEETNRVNEAYNLYEQIVFEGANEALMALSLIINRLIENKEYDRADIFIEHTKKAVSAFSMGEFMALQFDLQVAMAKKDKEKTIQSIKNILDKADTMDYYLDSELYKHNTNLHKSNRMELEKKRSILKNGYAKNKALDYVKDDPRIKSLLGID